MFCEGTEHGGILAVGGSLERMLLEVLTIFGGSVILRYEKGINDGFFSFCEARLCIFQCLLKDFPRK